MPMARKNIERNIAYDDIREKYYVTLDHGRNECNKRIKQTQTFYTLKEARKCLREFEYEKDRGNIVAPARETVESYVKYWIDDVKGISCRPTTLYGYRNIANKHMIPYLGQVEIQKLTAQHINKYSAHLKRDKHLDNNSIKKHQDMLKSMLRTAAAEKVIVYNFMQDMELFKYKYKEVEVYNSDQVKQLFKCLEDHPLELGVKLGVYLGLRRGEVSGLKWTYINFEEKSVYIKESRTQAGKEVYAGETKTQSSKRKLELCDELIDLLKKTKQEQEKNKALLGNEYFKSDYIICKKNGELYKPNYLSNEFKKFLERNGLPHIKYHALRHTCATIANEMGITLFDIASMLGHSSIAITSKIYTHQLDKTNSKAVVAVAKAFN